MGKKYSEASITVPFHVFSSPNYVLCKSDMLKLFWQGKSSQNSVFIFSGKGISLNAASFSFPVVLFLTADGVLEKMHWKFIDGNADLNRRLLYRPTVYASTPFSENHPFFFFEAIIYLHKTVMIDFLHYKDGTVTVTFLPSKKILNAIETLLL